MKAQNFAIIFFLALVGCFAALVIASAVFPITNVDPWVWSQLTKVLQGLPYRARQRAFIGLAVLLGTGCAYFGWPLVGRRVKNFAFLALANLLLIREINRTIGVLLTEPNHFWLTAAGFMVELGVVGAVAVFAFRKRRPPS